MIVFDADTGAYKRHWGAYGKKPDDSAPRTRVYEGQGSPQFNLVHGIRISNDGLVYVGDRVNNRIQVFRLDGTFVKENYIERKTSGAEGTAFDIAFSPDKQQKFFYVPDGSNKKVDIVNRENAGDRGLLRRAWRPRRRRLLSHPQRRDRFQRQHLHWRGQQRPARSALEL